MSRSTERVAAEARYDARPEVKLSSDTDAALDRLRAELEQLAPGEDGEQSAGFLLSVLAHMPALCCAVTPEGRFLYVNRTIPGLTVDEVVGKTIYDFMPESAHPAARAAIERACASGEPDCYVGYGPGRGGPASAYENWLAPIAADGRVVALTLITRDVSQEYEVQRRLSESEERLRIALDASGLGMWRVDLATGVVELDERMRAIYRADASRFDRGGFDRFIHPDDRDRVNAEAMRAIEERRHYRTDNRIVRGDGSVGWVIATGVPVEDAEGNVVAMVGTSQDVSERRELEDQLRQAQKLEAVGQLTAGIAHNFNNMLASIVPTLELVQGEVSPRNRELVESAQEAARRAAQMVRELLVFSGKRPPARQPAEVGELLDRVLRICRTTFDRSIAIESKVPPDVPHVAVDAPQVEQALMNILINARDALLDAQTPSPRVTVEVDAEPDAVPSGERYVRIRVSDNGPGMSADVRERIFEPFFTTKDIGRGTGLGLSTSYGILREHGGSVACASVQGEGTTFTLLLPATEEPVPRTASGGSRQRATPPATILLVEDEEVVRAVTARVLEDTGYLVIAAKDGDEALTALADHDDVKLVLLDLNMPGRPWTEVLSAIRTRRPGVKVVAFTGEPELTSIEAFDALVGKPTEPERLRAVVRDALER